MAFGLVCDYGDSQRDGVFTQESFCFCIALAGIQMRGEDSSGRPLGIKS